MPASTDFTDLDDISFLGRLSEALSQRIEEQTRPLFDDAGITVPVRSCSLLTALDAAGEASVSRKILRRASAGSGCCVMTPRRSSAGHFWTTS